MAVRFRPQSIPSDEELEYLNMQNAPLRFERTLDGELLVSPPSGFSIGQQNAELIRQLGNWNLQSGHGAVLDSSTGISIGLNASPDAAWISGDRVRTRARLRASLTERLRSVNGEASKRVTCGGRCDRDRRRPCRTYRRRIRRVYGKHGRRNPSNR